MKNSITILLFGLSFGLVIAFVPLAVLWGINTIVTGLFITATALPYTFWNWLAVFVLQLTIFAKQSLVKSK